MLSALAKYVINILIHGFFHIALVISQNVNYKKEVNKNNYNRLIHGLFHIALVISTRP
jgi:hypothetical protein